MVQDTALIHAVCSHHPAAVPDTSVISLLVNTVRRIRVGPDVFEELGFKMFCAKWDLSGVCNYITTSLQISVFLQQSHWGWFVLSFTVNVAELQQSGATGPVPWLERHKAPLLYQSRWPPLASTEGGQSLLAAFHPLGDRSRTLTNPIPGWGRHLLVWFSLWMRSKGIATKNWFDISLGGEWQFLHQSRLQTVNQTTVS